MELAEQKFNYKALEDEQLALDQKRKRVLEFLKKLSGEELSEGGEELPEYSSGWEDEDEDEDPSPSYYEGQIIQVDE